MDKDKILQAGEIAKKVREWIKPQIKKGVFLLEIAEKIEEKIIELGGKPAFPVNLSMNEVAAHYTPLPNDETKADGLLKVDFGIHVDGWTSDTAFSVDLEDSEENKKLIEASEKALENALNVAKENAEINQIGKAIEESIESYGFSPIINLSGHEMKQYELHAGLTIPNFDNNQEIALEKGLYAIEPFATSGNGKVKDGKDSGIYLLTDTRNVRSPIAREVLDFVIDEYDTLPFCSRWIVKKFGTKALFGLKQLVENGNLHNFAELVESSHKKVSQAEHTIFIGDKVIVTTR